MKDKYSYTVYYYSRIKLTVNYFRRFCPPKDLPQNENVQVSHWLESCNWKALFKLLKTYARAVESY